MQPGPRSEDINSILSRFQTWADKNPVNGAANGHGNGDASEEIREIPYEEAIRQLRDRQAAQSRRPPRPRARRAAAPSRKRAATPPYIPASPAAPAPPAAPQPSAPLQAAPRSGRWIDNLPVIPDTEPVIELRSAASAAAPSAPPPQTREDRIPPRSASVPAEDRTAMVAPTPAQRPSPRPPKTAPQSEAAASLFAAMPDLPAMPFVDLPAVALSARRRPERRTPARRLQPKPEPQAQTEPEFEPEMETAPEAPPRLPARPAAAAAALPPRRVATAQTPTPPPLPAKAAAPPPPVRKPMAARAEAPQPQRQAIPVRPAARPRVTATAVRAAKSQATAQTRTDARTQSRTQSQTQARSKARPQAGPALSGNPRSALIQSPMKAVARQPSAAVSRRQRLASAPRARKPERSHFRQVLANTVQQPKALLTPRKKPAPDRTRRITTRFTTAEERRIEKQASELGMTVSAYLRQCALAALASVSQKIEWEEEPAPVNIRKNGKQPAPASWQTNGYANSPSLLGGWLSLLRNRFLGPPIRFSEEA